MVRGIAVMGGGAEPPGWAKRRWVAIIRVVGSLKISKVSRNRTAERAFFVTLPSRRHGDIAARRAGSNRRLEGTPSLPRRRQHVEGLVVMLRGGWGVTLDRVFGHYSRSS